MRRELRVAALLTSPQFLGLLALFCGQLVLLRSGWVMRVETWIPLTMLLTVVLGLQQLALRIVRVGAADIWRLLPGGFTAFIRSVALLVLGVALLVGGLWSWSSGQLTFHSVPLGRMVMCYLLLSWFSVLTIIAILWRRSGYFIAAATIVSEFLLERLLIRFPEPVLWWTIALLFAAAWLYASFGKLPTLAASRRVAGPRRGTFRTPGSAMSGWQLRLSSPVRNVLQLEGRLLSRFVVAALVIVICALAQHLLLSRGVLIDIYPVSGLMALWFALIFLFDMGLAMTARARLTWLRIGNGRGGVFLAVERVLLVNLASLSLIAWLATTLLDASRGVSIQPTQAGMTLLWVAASALGPLYLALLAGTLQGWLSKIPMTLLACAAILISPFLWLPTLGFRNVGLEAPRYGAIALLACGILLLRVLATWRWRHLDWSKIRVKPSEPLFRRARTG